MQGPQLCWCWQAYSHTASLHEWPLARYQSNGWILPFMSIFLFKHFILSIFNCLCIVWKHFAQTCCSVTLADSQAFHQRFVFCGKTHSLHHRNVTSAWRRSVKNIRVSNFLLVEYLFHNNHVMKILWNCEHFHVKMSTFYVKCEHFHENIKQNVNGCFFLNTVYSSITSCTSHAVAIIISVA